MDNLQTIIIWGIPIIFAITFHEAAHGFVAYMLGDNTAKSMGRVTLNPLKHIDPIGTIAVPILTYFASGFIFGWARPVPVNFSALNNFKKDSILVAMAGPFSNLMMSFFWLLVMLIAFTYQQDILLKMANIGIMINLILMILNMLPLPPLDGSRVISVLIPYQMSYYYNKLEKYGILILIALLFAGLFEYFILPIVKSIYNLMIALIN